MTKQTFTYTSNRGFDADYYLDGDVVRWDSNDAVPFDDVLDSLLAAGRITKVQRDISIAARREHVRNFLAEYRRRQPAEPTAEERFEALAAHGPGVKVVDVITGRGFTT